MTRFVALLRGVSPMNAKMPELKRAFESAGFGNVKTVLGSGNVVFDAGARSEAGLARACEAAMEQALGRSFATIVRSAKALQALLDEDPWARFDLPQGAKRVVTFLAEPPAEMPALPIEREGARVLYSTGREVLTAYVPVPGNPVFMNLIEKTFGRNVTTRTWETVRKCAAA